MNSLINATVDLLVMVLLTGVVLGAVVFVDSWREWWRQVIATYEAELARQHRVQRAHQVATERAYLDAQMRQHLADLAVEMDEERRRRSGGETNPWRSDSGDRAHGGATR